MTFDRKRYSVLGKSHLGERKRNHVVPLLEVSLQPVKSNESGSALEPGHSLLPDLVLGESDQVAGGHRVRAVGPAASNTGTGVHLRGAVVPTKVKTAGVGYFSDDEDAMIWMTRERKVDEVPVDVADLRSSKLRFFECSSDSSSDDDNGIDQLLIVC